MTVELQRIAREAAGCQACDLWEPATQTVFGAGPADASMVLVGEQPGDREDTVGEPFVGPAGRVLDDALGAAGIRRDEVYVTNAVKHFKFARRGKRRIHQKPNATEIVACHRWIGAELAVLQPVLVVMMGTVAVRSVLGRPATITSLRGRTIEIGAVTGLVTIHPSAILRARDDRTSIIGVVRRRPSARRRSRPRENLTRSGHARDARPRPATRVTPASGNRPARSDVSTDVSLHRSHLQEHIMNTSPRTRALVAGVGIVVALGIGTAVAVAADGGSDDTPIPVEPDGGIGDTPIPVEPDGGIGDTPIPVEPDGGIGDTPIPVEPDGGIGDTPGDEFPVEQTRNDAHGLLGRFEADLPADVRIARKGAEQFALTEDYVLGRFTVELDDDGDGFRVTSVTVELPDGPETLELTPG